METNSLITHMSCILKWTRRSSPKIFQPDTNVLQFENLETVVEGNEIGVLPYKIRVSDDGELYDVDEVNISFMKITPPSSQYSRGRMVAGSFQGKTGHAAGKSSNASKTATVATTDLEELKGNLKEEVVHGS